ncbi:hypothetical protein PybrP1_003724 [[Pythium] brassicae (nom. inval.)]|nr:hypothetical protein PybrP1_003724 [[Pythium] brassicae (nom. inval.)]
MADSTVVGEQVQTLKMNDGQYEQKSDAPQRKWWGPWTRAEREPEPPPPPPRQFASTAPAQHWLKQRLLACCCVANPAHVPTRRSPGGLLRKYDDMELHRRRSTTVLLDAPLSSESGKVLSFGRQRNSGVHRLLRSSTSSCSSAGSPSVAVSADAGAPPLSPTAERAHSNKSAPSTTAEEEQPPSGVSGVASDPLSGSSFHSAIDDEQALVVSEYQGHVFPDHVWTHVVLKMTAFSDEDAVTSFRFGTDGGTIGRDAAPANTASVPADKLMKKLAHARVLYAHGGFYLQNCDESSSGTFVRLGPSCEEPDEAGDDDGGRMQWPLDPGVVFRAGKSDFVVVAFNEINRTLELEALGGKLQGVTFTVTTDGAGIGRSADNEIHAGDGELSRRHAAIWFDELTHKFYLIDLGSTNGTFMKLVGPYGEPYRLEIGDDLLVSQTCLTVNRFDFGVHANMGARKYMEDAHTIIQDLNIEALSCLGLHPQSFFAVYDGHGGAEASAFLGDTLHHNVIDEFRFTKKQFDPLPTLPRDAIHAVVRQRLIAAFEKTDDEFLRESARPQAGSTATTVLVAGNQLFVANVGDSRTVLSRKRVAVRLSNDHKPSRPDEAQRIRDTGGFVIHGRIMGELAVSRAFGDSPFKSFEAPEPPPALDAERDASKKPRSDYDSQELPFLLLASDGLFDVLKDQDAVDFLHKKLSELHDIQRAVEAMVEHAIFQQRSTDNVTAVVIMFKEPTELLPVV